MSWRDLLDQGGRSPAVPWLGGHKLRLGVREWDLMGFLPQEHGWYTFTLDGRRAADPLPAEPDMSNISSSVAVGFLVGDQLTTDGPFIYDRSGVTFRGRTVHLIPEGLDRFTRVVAGNAYEGGPLVFRSQEMPLGPEDEVLAAFLDRAPSIDHIKNVTPALELAFRLECWVRDEAERVRRELAERRAREAAERAAAERRHELFKQLGDGAGRRAMARYDFAEAARAALAVGGAELLDARPGYEPGEKVVRYRLMGRRFECVCDEATLRIVDSGICLTSHDTGVRYDDRFTLESLPPVIVEAERQGKLVIYRHA